MLEIIIKADTNDADYITSINSITEETLAKITPLIQAIKDFKPYITMSPSGLKHNHSSNYPYGECVRKDLGEKSPKELYKFDDEIFELFEELLPYDECGLHKIESIYVCPLVEKQKLL